MTRHGEASRGRSAAGGSALHCTSRTPRTRRRGPGALRPARGSGSGGAGRGALSANYARRPLPRANLARPCVGRREGVARGRGTEAMSGPRRRTMGQVGPAGRGEENHLGSGSLSRVYQLGRAGSGGREERGEGGQRGSLSTREDSPNRQAVRKGWSARGGGGPCKDGGGGSSSRGERPLTRRAGSRGVRTKTVCVSDAVRGSPAGSDRARRIKRPREIRVEYSVRRRSARVSSERSCTAAERVQHSNTRASA